MNIGAIIQTWISVLTQPGEEIFEQQRSDPQANVTTAVIWIFAAGVIGAVLSFLGTLLSFQSTADLSDLIYSLDLPPEVAGQMETLLQRGVFTGLAGGAGLLGIVLTPVFFLIGVGILHLIATMLGGQGQFGTYAYLTATFRAPLTIAQSLLGFVPVLGACLAGILSVYALVLAYFATKVNYSLSGGRALVVVLVPVILLFLLMGCVLLFLIMGFAAIMSN